MRPIEILFSDVLEAGATLEGVSEAIHGLETSGSPVVLEMGGKNYKMEHDRIIWASAVGEDSFLVWIAPSLDTGEVDSKELIELFKAYYKECEA